MRLSEGELPPTPYPGTRWIPLTQGKLALVDDDDYEWLSRYKWCFLKAGYAIRGAQHDDGRFKMVYMHRELRKAPDGLQVDHISRDKLDNRKANLRIATQTEQRGNMPLSKRNKSGYRGVYFRKDTKKWAAMISICDRGVNLGSYDTPELAAAAYDMAAIKHFGLGFATLNFLPMELGI